MENGHFRIACEFMGSKLFTVRFIRYRQPQAAELENARSNKLIFITYNSKGQSIMCAVASMPCHIRPCKVFTNQTWQQLVQSWTYTPEPLVANAKSASLFLITLKGL